MHREPRRLLARWRFARFGRGGYREENAGERGPWSCVTQRTLTDATIKVTFHSHSGSWGRATPLPPPPPRRPSLERAPDASACASCPACAARIPADSLHRRHRRPGAIHETGGLGEAHQRRLLWVSVRGMGPLTISSRQSSLRGGGQLEALSGGVRESSGHRRTRRHRCIPRHPTDTVASDSHSRSDISNDNEFCPTTKSSNKASHNLGGKQKTRWT